MYLKFNLTPTCYCLSSGFMSLVNDGIIHSVNKSRPPWSLDDKGLKSLERTVVIGRPFNAQTSFSSWGEASRITGTHCPPLSLHPQAWHPDFWEQIGLQSSNRVQTQIRVACLEGVMPGSSSNTLNLGHIFPTKDGGGPLCCWLIRGSLFAIHFLNLIREPYVDFPDQSW